MRADLCAAALDQKCVEEVRQYWYLPPCRADDPEVWRAGVRYVHMEVGHAARNVYLQTVSLGLGTVVVEAFDDGEVERLFQMEDDERALCIMPAERG